MSTTFNSQPTATTVHQFDPNTVIIRISELSAITKSNRIHNCHPPKQFQPRIQRAQRNRAIALNWGMPTDPLSFRAFEPGLVSNSSIAGRSAS